MRRAGHSGGLEGRLAGRATRMLRALAVVADLALVALVACCLRLGKGGPGRSAPTHLGGKSRRWGPTWLGEDRFGRLGWALGGQETAPNFAENRVKELDFSATASRAWPSFGNASWGPILYRDLLQKSAASWLANRGAENHGSLEFQKLSSSFEDSVVVFG